MKQQITEQQIGVITQQHQQWLDHPITKQMFSILEKQEERIVSELMSNSLVGSETVIERQQQMSVVLSVQLKTVNNIKSITKETHKFISKLT